jgi:ribosomal protein S18 acetylase RimI-like enzyme
MNHRKVIIQEVSLQDAPIELLLLADPSRDMIEQYLTRSTIFSALYKSEIIGILVLYPIQELILEIKNLAVIPNYQNKGIGKLLIQIGEDFARSNGYNVLRICTGNTSFPQLALYQRTGFQIKDKIENYFLENYSEPIFENGILCKDLIIMEKEINKSLIFPVMP